MTEPLQQSLEILEELIRKADPAGLNTFFRGQSNQEIAWYMYHLEPDEQAHAMELLEPEYAADLLESFSEPQAVDILEELAYDQAAHIIDQMQSDRQADILAEMPPEDAQSILSEMEAEEAQDARLLMAYEPEQAGGMMITEYLSYRADQTVQQVLEDLRGNAETYAEYDIQYAYITDANQVLSGVLRQRDLLFASPDTRIATLIQPEVVSVSHRDPLEDLHRFFQDHFLMGAPVVDEQNRLVGVIRRSSVIRARQKRANTTFLRLSGIIGGEELRSMPLHSRSARRLSWLSINIVLNIIAASVIAAFQGTLEQVITLAIFLPMISDMSGCSGNQAVAVSMRELSLGLVRPREIFLVLIKEAGLGIVNGIALGLLLALVAGLWTGNTYLGLVVGVALAFNTLISVIIGGCLPLLMRRFGIDPALVSGPALTTVTDMCGFFLTLGLATLMLQHLI